VEAVEAGAPGFLGKEEAAGEVLSAAKAAAEGEVLIDPATLTRLLHQVSLEREAQRMPKRSSGSSPNGNGGPPTPGGGDAERRHRPQALHQPPDRPGHVRNLLAKLGVHSKLEAVAFAVKHGLISI
jgi:DNA-binding NarL/FixJ family response regulator